MNRDLEQLAQDLLIDIQSHDIKELVIAAEGKLSSISPIEFEELKSRLAEIAPGVKVFYKLSA
jgi:hypothetical protein